MDSAHALAVVCRAKQICRETGVVAPDAILGYLCQCAHLNGTWIHLIGGEHGAGAAGEAVLSQIPLSYPTAQQEANHVESQVDHAVLVKAIEKLARSIANDFIADSIPVRLATIQLEMERTFQSHQLAMEEEQREHKERVAAKTRVLLGAKRKHITVQEMNSIYNQEQDVRAAVESVFPFSSLAQFLTSSRSEKDLQLDELPYIVAGVCLFKQSTGASQAGACTAALQQHTTDPQDTLQECIDQLQFVRKTLLCYSGSLSGGKPVALHAERLLWCQAQTFLAQLHFAASTSCSALARLASEMSASVSEVEDLVQGTNAVPKQTVLPLFHRIGQLFEATLEERRLATMHQALLDTVLQMIGTLPGSVKSHHVHMPNAADVAALATSGNTEWLDAEEAALQGSARGDEPVCTPVDGLGSEHAAWGGMDIVVFVRHDGLLLPVAPDATYVQQPPDAGLWFGFSSSTAAEEFGRRPLAYIRAARKVLLQKPYMVPIVGQLDDSLPPLLTRVLSMGYHILRLDCATQTPTHFVEQHVDSRYQWNQWALRRQALELANLQTKVTKSAQTGVSSFRRDNESQYWQPKIAMSQTPHNKGQCMPKKLRYMTGLRGDPIGMKFNVVSLELDLGQPHQL